MVEYLGGDLTRGRLQQLLDSRGVDRHTYDLAGSSLGEQYVMDQQGSRWCVFYSERGLRSGERAFVTEHDACEHLLSVLLADPTTRRKNRSDDGLNLFRFVEIPTDRLNTYVSAAGWDEVPGPAWPVLWERNYPDDRELNPFHRFGVNNADCEALAVWRAFSWNLLDGLKRLAIPAYHRDEAAALLGVPREQTTLVRWEYQIDTDEPDFSTADHGFVGGRSAVPIRPEPDSWQRANRERAGLFELSSFEDLTRVDRAVSFDASSEIAVFGLEPGEADRLPDALTREARPDLSACLGERGVFVDLCVVRDRFPGTTSYLLVRSRAALGDRIRELADVYQSRFLRYVERVPEIDTFEGFGRALDELLAAP